MKKITSFLSVGLIVSLCGSVFSQTLPYSKKQVKDVIHDSIDNPHNHEIGSMAWPNGGAGIPFYDGASGWGSSISKDSLLFGSRHNVLQLGKSVKINDSTHYGSEVIEVRAKKGPAQNDDIGKFYIQHWGNYTHKRYTDQDNPGWKDNHRIQKIDGTLLFSRNIATVVYKGMLQKVIEHGYDYYGQGPNENLYTGSGCTLELGQEGFIFYTNRHATSLTPPVTAGILRVGTTSGMTYSKAMAIGLDRPYNMPKLASLSIFPADASYGISAGIYGYVSGGVSYGGIGQSILGLFNNSNAPGKKNGILFALGQTTAELAMVSNGDYPETGVYGEIMKYSTATTGPTTFRRGGVMLFSNQDSAGVALASEHAKSGGIRLFTGSVWDSLQWWLKPDGRMYVKRLLPVTKATKIITWENNHLKYISWANLIDTANLLVTKTRLARAFAEMASGGTVEPALPYCNVPGKVLSCNADGSKSWVSQPGSAAGYKDSIWTTYNGSGDANNTLAANNWHFKGSYTDACDLNMSLFKCYSANGDTLKYGYVRAVKRTQMVNTVTVTANKIILPTDIGFSVSIMNKINNYCKPVTIPGTLAGDAANSQGMWYSDFIADTSWLLPVDAGVLSAASGGSPATAFNVYVRYPLAGEDSTAFSRAPDIYALDGTIHKMISGQVPKSWLVILDGATVTIRIISSAGTSLASNFQANLFIVPKKTFYAR